jgi:hypothetical protein
MVMIVALASAMTARGSRVREGEYGRTALAGSRCVD